MMVYWFFGGNVLSIEVLGVTVCLERNQLEIVTGPFITKIPLRLSCHFCVDLLLSYFLLQKKCEYSTKKVQYFCRVIV
jgi:hypothetical protein